MKTAANKTAAKPAAPTTVKKARKKAAKKTVKKVAPVEFKVWCDRCSIRIAPNEAQIEKHGKSYHASCKPRTP